MDEEAERLVVQMAKENPSWGYILRRHGLSPAPKQHIYKDAWSLAQAWGPTEPDLS